MSRIGIVCDSTCDLGYPWLAEQHDMAMVPLKVLIGEETFLDWIDLNPETFFKRLDTAAVLPKTSQPSPSDFATEYTRLSDAGCTGIVSVHLTGALSGTVQSAHLAAQDAAIPVRVVDTKMASAGVAICVEAAIRARDAGADLGGIEAAAQDVADASRLLFALDTLEYLVKGGRAGKAQGLAASVLNIKPILTFNAEGTIEPFKKVKGTRKAIAEIAAQAAADADGRPLNIALLHSMAPDLAAELRAALDAAGVTYDLRHTTEVGAVIGTYAGRRAIGLVYYPEA
jgi:DegV family protein with EDD domain